MSRSVVSSAVCPDSAHISQTQRSVSISPAIERDDVAWLEGRIVLGWVGPRAGKSKDVRAHVLLRVVFAINWLGVWKSHRSSESSKRSWS